MYKPSTYNIIRKIEENSIVYNSLTQKLSIFSNANLLSLQNGDFISSDYPYFSELLENGYILREDINEEDIARLKRFDLSANSGLEFIIIPTTQCNFRCVYCYETFQNHVMDPQVIESIILYIKKNIRFFSSLKVGWYGGEPLLETEKIEYISKKLIDICNSNGKPYLSNITTNGYLLTPDVIRMLIKSHVTVFVITLDGVGDIHDEYRHLQSGEGSFNQIIENLRYIRDKVRNRMIRILIRTNVTKKNSKYLVEYINFISNEFGKDSRFEFLIYPVCDWGGESISEVKDSLLNSFDEIYDLLINSKQKLNYNPFLRHLNLSSCWAVKRNSYIIDPAGALKKCTMLIDSEQSNVGYLNSKGELIVDRATLSKWILHGENESKTCKKCTNKKACTTFCPLKRYFDIDEGSCEFHSFDAGRILELIIKNSTYLEIQRY